MTYCAYLYSITIISFVCFSHILNTNLQKAIFKKAWKSFCTRTSVCPVFISFVSYYNTYNSVWAISMRAPLKERCLRNCLLFQKICFPLNYSYMSPSWCYKLEHGVSIDILYASACTCVILWRFFPKFLWQMVILPRYYSLCSYLVLSSECSQDVSIYTSMLALTSTISSPYNREEKIDTPKKPIRCIYTHTHPSKAVHHKKIRKKNWKKGAIKKAKEE